MPWEFDFQSSFAVTRVTVPSSSSPSTWNILRTRVSRWMEEGTKVSCHRPWDRQYCETCCIVAFYSTIDSILRVGWKLENRYQASRMASIARQDFLYSFTGAWFFVGISDNEKYDALCDHDECICEFFHGLILFQVLTVLRKNTVSIGDVTGISYTSSFGSPWFAILVEEHSYLVISDRNTSYEIWNTR